MLLSDVCIVNVACCTARTTILEAAYMMRKMHAGDLVVVENEGDAKVPLGIVTDRDIVVEVLGTGMDPATTTVKSITRSPLVVAREDEDSSQALERMRAHGIRRIPVVGSRGTLVGIVTVDDLMKGLAEEAGVIAEIVSRERNHEERARR